MDMNILFTNGESVPNYFPGEMVTGVLVINLASEMTTISRIIINLEGKGNVCIGMSEDAKYASEKYCDYTLTVLQAQSNHGITLAKGEYRFPFTFKLPQAIPSSFSYLSSSSGEVKYHVKGKVVRNWKQDKKIKQEIIVDGILDLNTLPWHLGLKPGERRTSKKIDGIFCTSGPISATIQTDRCVTFYCILKKFHFESAVKK